MANPTHIFLEGRFEADFISRKVADKRGREQVRLKLGNVRVNHAQLSDGPDEAGEKGGKTIVYRDKVAAVVEVVEEDSGQILDSDCKLTDCVLSRVEVEQLRSTGGQVRGRMYGHIRSLLGPYSLQGMPLDRLRLLTCLPGLPERMHVKAGARYWRKKAVHLTGWLGIGLASLLALATTIAFGSPIGTGLLVLIIILSAQATFTGQKAEKFRIVFMYLLGALILLAFIIAIILAEQDGPKPPGR